MSRIRPSPMTRTRSAYAAAFESWVTRTTVWPAPDARLPQRVEDLGPRGVVEVARRFVGEEQRRPGDQGPRDRHALLLTGRQLVGLVASLGGQVDEGDDVVDALAQLAAGRVAAGDGEGQRHVLGDVEERDEVEGLEDEPGPLAPEAGGCLVGEAG